MPDVTVRNNTSSCLNIGFCITTPLAFENEVKPEQTIRLHLSSFVHTVEVRQDNGSNRFTPGESWRKFGEISGACAAGATAVAVGTGWVFGMFGPRTSPVGSTALVGAGAAWNAAHAGQCLYLISDEGVTCVLAKIVRPVQVALRTLKVWMVSL